MLNLKDAFAGLEQAKKQERTLQKAFNDWAQSGGIQVVGERDPVYARYGWFVVMHREPSENLALVAGEIFNNLRNALNYIAFQIYTVGGGDPTVKQAKAVAFPIVEEEERWKTVVAANVPNAWDEAVEKLTWCQPFVQIGPQSTALPALRGVGATDKHHNLVLYAMAPLSIGGIAPELKEDQGVIMMAQPGPVVKLEEPGLIGMVYMTKGQNVPPDEENLVPWSEAVELQPPPPPTVQFGFRATDGSEVTIEAIGGLISYVEEILNRFSKLKKPKQSQNS
ncbi:hypothetical protein AU184_03760 [Mycolicibacterium novocastrense]|uniref:hypothetical protein n=1 Tax=Mycolicibacterium novocastrense TaxID=59813 RepID=UPI000746EC26|nr:hypothetical protein [Mycolicibacterium novocastrense]KUH70728.1 hypothetical protein AU183_18090 [Mycolicibacterium novocastrense]KUH71732.1 hypothetical protein AU072_11085 [Mycolicibacterium novocastrense]KUH72047.1 hypothetical protein AU184_03760 [Mycolicibacterium novocastrense]